MIIDGHTHAHGDPDGLGDRYDARIEGLVDAMDAAGVDRALIMAEAVDVPYIKPISNAYVAECCERFPDRLVGFASVHPAHPHAEEELHEALTNMGLRGLKLHPRFQGVAADDPRSVALIRSAAELGAPVAIDALLWKPTPLALQLPIRIDALCKAVPEAKIIMNHAGGFHFLDALAVAIANDNVYLELSVALEYFHDTPFEEQFLFVLSKVGPRRLMFGSDHPQKDMKAALELTKRSLQRIGFSETELSWVMGKTLKAVLSPGDSL